MVALIIWILFGMMAAIVATAKGRDGVVWFMVGVLLGPLGLVFALIMQKDEDAVGRQALLSGDRKKCPFCAELIKPEAIKCRFCGSDVSDTVEVAERLPSGLMDLRARLGDGVVGLASTEEGSWTCVCGQDNPFDTEVTHQHCTPCRRNRDFLLTNFGCRDGEVLERGAWGKSCNFRRDGGSGIGRLAPRGAPPGATMERMVLGSRA